MRVPGVRRDGPAARVHQRKRVVLIDDIQEEEKHAEQESRRGCAVRGAGANPLRVRGRRAARRRVPPPAPARLREGRDGRSRRHPRRRSLRVDAVAGSGRPGRGGRVCRVLPRGADRGPLARRPRALTQVQEGRR